MAMVWKELGGAKVAQGSFYAEYYEVGLNINVDCGFKPKKVVVYSDLNDSSYATSCIYNEEISTELVFYSYKLGSTQKIYNKVLIDSTSSTDSVDGKIISINDNGFTVVGLSAYMNLNYFAVG